MGQEMKVTRSSTEIHTVIVFSLTNSSRSNNWENQNTGELEKTGSVYIRT
jgi:hypothetical protein